MGKSKFNGKFRFRGTLLDPLDEGRRSFQLKANLLSCKAARSLPLPHLEPVSLPVASGTAKSGSLQAGPSDVWHTYTPCWPQEEMHKAEVHFQRTLALSLGLSSMRGDGAWALE